MTGDADLRITGHIIACGGYMWLGEFTKSVEHADKVLEMYDAEKHCHLADVLNHDPKTFAGAFGSMSTWVLGFPDRALRLNNEKDVHAHRRGHLFDLGFALFRGAHVFDHRFGHKDLHKRAEECERLGRENSLPVFWAILAPLVYGQAFLREGKPAEAIAPIRASIGAWEATGGELNGPIQRAFLAEAMALAGDLDGALLLLDEAIAQVERPRWEERLYYAEILRLKGWMLSLKGDLEGAERDFLASLDWARRQRAKMWALRTSTSLARLWQGQGRRQDAYELLAPIYDWFAEGFDTKDLLEAKALLAELG
jgi:tetratricopeptide (TPR) repeat protein